MPGQESINNSEFQNMTKHSSSRQISEHLSDRNMYTVQYTLTLMCLSHLFTFASDFCAQYRLQSTKLGFQHAMQEVYRSVQAFLYAYT